MLNVFSLVILYTLNQSRLFGINTKSLVLGEEMDQTDLDNWVIKENLKFDYTFTTLIFATLGLSIQFSPKIGTGNEWPYLLIAAWIILLVSAFTGGFRLLKLQYLYQLDAQTSAYVRSGNDLGTKKGRTLIAKEDAALKPLIYIRLWGYLIGISLNLAFAIVNYLHQIPVH